MNSGVPQPPTPNVPLSQKMVNLGFTQIPVDAFCLYLATIATAYAAIGIFASNAYLHEGLIELAGLFAVMGHGAHTDGE